MSNNPGAPDIRKALEARLAALTGVLPTQFENVVFTPTAVAYQRVNLIMADPLNLEWGRSYQQNGYMQITLSYPINTGPGAAETMAQTLRDWFYRGLQLAANGLTVTVINTPSISSGGNVGDRFLVFVKVRFFANASL